MKKHTFPAVLAHLIALLMLSIVAKAAIVVGVRGDQFLSINPSTGASDIVGPLGVFVDRIAFNSAGTLYGTSDKVVDNAHIKNLVTINTSTGLVTMLAPLSYTVNEPSLPSIYGLAFNHQGILYGIDGAANNSRLVQINTLSGAITIVGSSGFTELFGLAFAANGALFSTNPVTNELVSINPFTGEGSLLGQLNGGMTIRALSFDENGSLYGIDSLGLESNLVTIDTNSRDVTIIGSLGFPSVNAIAISPIPEPRMTTLALMTALLVLARRSKPSTCGSRH